MTREELAALSNEQLSERVALELMGYTAEAFGDPLGTYVAWKRQGANWSELTCPAFSTDLHRAWEVAQRMMWIPQSAAEASIAPNTRFGYAFEREAFKLVCSSEAEVARWICTEALLAWTAGPLDDR